MNYLILIVFNDFLITSISSKHIVNLLHIKEIHKFHHLKFGKPSNPLYKHVQDNSLKLVEAQLLGYSVQNIFKGEALVDVEEGGPADDRAFDLVFKVWQGDCSVVDD